MAFEGLAEKLQNIFQKLTRRGKLTDLDIKAAMREVRLALLEADVNFLVAKQFVARVSEKASGKEVMESLTPGQQVIKIVRDELTELLGGTRSEIRLASAAPTVILMAGLQGAGKTTMCAKLALHYKKQGKSVMLAACDVYRPAAKEQLKVVGQAAGAEVFAMDGNDPVKIAKAALAQCKKNLNDILIIDTAGRLHIDEGMMAELRQLKEALNPQEVLLVVDAMVGQDAVAAAKAFNEEVPLTGVILTKIDGDTRGGAALSVKEVTGKPIKFVGVGEKIEDIEPFYPDRMAGRILGMGDVLTLIEKAEKNLDEKKALEMQEKLRTQQFNLNDFLEQLQQIRSMGSLQDMVRMIPGASKLAGGAEVDESQMKKVEAIIQSMTKKERESPDIINSGRRKRIAAGSGTTVQDVNRLLNQFAQMKKAMKMFSGKKGKMRGLMGLPF